VKGAKRFLLAALGMFVISYLAFPSTGPLSTGLDLLSSLAAVAALMAYLVGVFLLIAAGFLAVKTFVK
jgi:hypothetical protein